MSWTTPSHNDNKINSVGLLKQKVSTISTNKMISSCHRKFLVMMIIILIVLIIERKSLNNAHKQNNIILSWKTPSHNDKNIIIVCSLKKVSQQQR